MTDKPLTAIVAPKAPYSLYLLLCKGGVIYTGITNDMDRRYQQHLAGRGAKFTRSRPPQEILCQALVGDRSHALQLEYQVKQLPRSQKVAFVESLTETPEVPK